MNRTILIVEDDLPFGRSLQSILVRNNWETVLVSDAQEGLRALNTTRLDAVICDLQLPGDCGLPLIRAARADSNIKAVIAISGMIDADFFLTVANRAGAHQVLTKPFNEQELLTALLAINQP
jgi:DNA-binding response OmpR family regulator